MYICYVCRKWQMWLKNTANQIFQKIYCLISILAKHFLPNLNRQFDEEMKNLYQSTMTASMHNKRRNFQEFQDKINSMVDNIKLFEKGVQCFENEDKDKLEKYLMKTLCSDLLNEALSYMCQVII